MDRTDLGDRSSAFTAESLPDAYERLLVPSLFEPWADVLLDTAEIPLGPRVLDIASGTGVVARAAARRAGPGACVVASDVSAPMLSRSAAVAASADAASITFQEASADALPFEDASFDVVLCQQGLQFFPAQQAAVDEMRRVVRPAGVVAIAVWAQGHPLEPFGVYCEELARLGAEPPFPLALESDTYTMPLEVVRELFEHAGFSSVGVRVVELEVTWPDVAAAAAGVWGTPFAPAVLALPTDQRERYDAAVLARFAPDEPGRPVRRTSAAVIVRAIA